MFRPLVLIACLMTLSIQVGCSARIQLRRSYVPRVPYSLYDQAVQKLAELYRILDASVSDAEYKIDDLVAAQIDYGDDVYLKAKLELEDESARINGSIADIKNLANGVDIESCLRGPQQQLANLLQSEELKVSSCVQEIINRVGEQRQITTNVIEQVWGDYYTLNGNLDKCGADGSIICISPIVRKIDADKIELPEKVDKEVRKFSEFLETISPEIDQCPVAGITEYVTQSGAILDGIERCVNGILG